MQMTHYRRRGEHQIPFYWGFSVANSELIGQTEKRVSGVCVDAQSGTRGTIFCLHFLPSSTPSFRRAASGELLWGNPYTVIALQEITKSSGLNFSQ